MMTMSKMYGQTYRRDSAKFNKMSKKDLFLTLAKPNKNGISRWVSVSEFVGIYKDLQLGNGGSWCEG